MASASPMPKLPKICRMALIWPRTWTVTPRGGVPARAIARSMSAAARAQVILAKIGGKANHPKSVLAVQFAGHVPSTHGSHLVDERVGARRACDWNCFDVLDGGHLRLRYFYLHLVADAGRGISPVIGRNEAAGGR